MLKTIGKNDVRLGMFIQGLEGSWISHPFWRSKFLLENPADLEALRSSRVAGVVIDTAKGADTVKGEAPLPPTAVAAQEPPPKTRAARPRKLRAILGGAAEDRGSSRPSGLAEEIDRAAAVLRRSREAAEEFLSKDFGSGEEALAQLRPVLAELSSSLARNASALIILARERPQGSEHASRAVSVGALMTSLGRQLGFKDEALSAAGFIGFTTSLSRPGTREEAAAIDRARDETERSLDVLTIVNKRIAAPADATVSLKQLSRNERTILSGMGLVCDVYDSMTHLRGAGEICTPAEAVSQLYRLRDHFDPNVLNAFIRSVGIYPSGSLVQLDSGHLAVVTDQDAGSLTQPVVSRFFCLTSMDWMKVEKVTLATGRNRILSREDPRHWGFVDFGRDWLPLVVSGELPRLSHHPRQARRRLAG